MADDEGPDLSLGLRCGASSAKPKEVQETLHKKPREQKGRRSIEYQKKRSSELATMADDDMPDLSSGLPGGPSSAKPEGKDPPPENQDSSPENQDSGEKNPAELIEFLPQRGQWFRKEMTSTDILSGRLVIPGVDFKKCIEPILREGEDVKEGIPVAVRVGEEKLFKMQLKVAWRSASKVALIDGWRNFAMSHNPQAGDVVTMRMSRNSEDTGLWLDVSWEKSTPGAGPSGSPAKNARLN